MIRAIYICPALIAIMLSALELRGAEIPVSASQVDAKFIAFRQSIRSGIVEFELEQGSRVSKHRVVFGEGGFRGDNVLPNKDLGGEFRESFVFPAGSDVVMFYSDEKFSDGGILVGSIQKVDMSSQLMAPPDPRVIGVCATPFKALPHMSLNTVFANPEWERSSPKTDRVDGRDCLFISYSKPSGAINVWFDPQRNMNPVRIVGRFGSVEETLECELKDIAKVGWFPSRVRYFRTSDGKVSMMENIRVNVVEFNKPIDVSAFTWAGMGVPDGHPINDRSTGEGQKRMVMKDGTLVDRVNIATDVAEESQSAQFSGRWIYLLAGTTIAVVALWLIWKRQN